MLRERTKNPNAPSMAGKKNLTGAEILGLVFALLCAGLSLYWPDVERVFLRLIGQSTSRCPYLSSGGRSSGENTLERTPSPYTVFENGFVLMAGDDGRRIESGFVVDHGMGRFVDVSMLSPAALAHASVVDLDGAIVTPGFVDPHVHFLSAGLALLGRVIDVRDVANVSQLKERMRLGAEKLADGEWAVGYGYQHELGDVASLDGLPVPTVVFRFDSHQLLANERALTLAGITAATLTPPGGDIKRDASGRPTGVLCDAAMGLLTRAIPTPSEEVLKEAFMASEAYALSKGVTRVGDMGRVSFDDPFSSLYDLQGVFIPMAEAGKMRVRVDAFVSLKALDVLKQLVATIGSSFGNGKLRVGGVKEFYDGSLSSKTALFTKPYKDNERGDDSSAGIRLVDRDVYEKMVQAADAEGFAIATHAIGSRAVDEVLAVYEKLPVSSRRRHRIEHAQHMSSVAAIRRLAAAGLAGVTPNPQHWVFDRDVIATRLHDDDGMLAYPLDEFRKSGVNIGLSSDAPVVPLDPLRAVADAMDKRNPFALGAWDALHGITRGGHLLSLAGEDEDRMGFIAPDWPADFVLHTTTCDSSCTVEAAVSRLVDAREQDGLKVFIAGKQVV